MHSFPFWTCVACVLAERSRSALQALGYLCSRWLPLPGSHPFPKPPRRCVQPRACACSRAAPVCISYSWVLSARPDGRFSQISADT
eukprot:893970-Pleurochrysis_carterae.AAC.3